MKCTCGVEVKNHPAEPCLDAMFCTEVMRWEYFRRGNYEFWKQAHRIFIDIRDFSPSTNISHAMQGVKVAFKKNLQKIIIDRNSDGTYYVGLLFEKIAYFHTSFSNDAETIELGLTRALILWAQEKGE